MRGPRCWALLLAGLSALAGGLSAQVAERSGARAIFTLLEDARAGVLQPAQVRSRVAALGPVAAPDLCALLSSSGPAGPAGLSRAEKDLLFAVVPSWPADEVAAELGAVLPAPTLEQRLLVLRLLGATGAPEAVPHMAGTLAAIDSDLQQTKLVQDAAQSAWTALLRADRGTALAALNARVADLDLPQLFALVRALGELDHGGAAPILERLEYTSPRLDPLVLAALGGIPRYDPSVRGGSVTRLLRRRLIDDDAETRRAAAMALGRLRDAESVPELLLLLEGEPDARVRRAAFDAVTWASGESTPGHELARWQRWLTEEDRWLAELSGARVSAALNAPPAQAAAALRELSAHPLHRERLAEELAPALKRPEEEVVVAACGALARLGASAGILPLVALRADPRADVQRAALAALREATDGRFPLASEDQRDWIEAHL